MLDWCAGHQSPMLPGAWQWEQLLQRCFCLQLQRGETVCMHVDLSPTVKFTFQLLTLYWMQGFMQNKTSCTESFASRYIR